MPTRSPNIVVFFVDDMGYGDASCLNPEGRIATPNFDRLAAEGMIFTDAHSSSAVCSPSRYGLLTGRYNWRSPLQAGIVNPYGDPLIARDRLTVGGLLQRHGYRTGCIGKWHLGMGWDFDRTDAFLPDRDTYRSEVFPHDRQAADEERRIWCEAFAKPTTGGPTTRGFDYYFGVDVPNWPPFCYIENDRTLGTPSEFLPARMLEHHQASIPGPAMPYWHFEQLLPTWARKADAFIAQSASRHEPFFLYLPMTSPHTPLAVNPEWIGRSGLDNLYADLVMETDDMFGRVLDSLDRYGVAEDTLVLFTSDNGCAPYIGVQQMEAQGHYPSGRYRGYKSDAWDGGHRIPCIVRWPGVVSPGSATDHIVCLTDLMATVAAIVGDDLPDSAAEDSASLLPLLRGKDRAVRENVIHHSISGKFAIRDQRWKLVLCPGSGGWTKRDDEAAAEGLPLVQLYDMASDPEERHNLESDRRDVVRTMLAELERIVAAGRSTPGETQSNDVEVDIWKLHTMPGVEPAMLDDY